MKKKVFIPILTLGALTLCSAVALTTSSYILAKSQETGVEGLEIKESYALGETLKIEESARITSGTNKYLIDSSVLYFPDGTVVNAKEFKLSLFGKYKLLLTSKEFNGTVSYTKEFNVTKNYYNVSNAASSVTFGKLNTNPSYNFRGENGLLLDLAENDTFTYAEPFNIYEQTENFILYYNALYMTPSLKSIDIRLTDAYNPNIYIDILNRRGSYEYQNCFAFGAYGQRAVGLDESESGGITIDGVKYKPAFESLGTLVDANNSTSGAYNPMKIYLDTTSRTNIKLIVETETIYGKHVISELNNPSIYSYGFDGFTNGNVYLSITTSNYDSISTGKLGISHLIGMSEDELNLFKEYKDENAPIFISSVGEDSRQIKANVELKVPSIQVFDDTGVKGDYDYTVWYNYDSPTGNMIEVVDDRFVPTKLGTYTILYNATDVYGNIGTYRLDLFASSKGTTGLDFNCTKIVSPNAGSAVSFEEYSVSSLNGGVTVGVEVQKPDGTFYVGKPEDDFFIDQVGEYTVTYSYSDFFYDGIYSYSFTSVTDGKAKFEKNFISTNKYYIKGMTYSIEDVRAYKYEGISQAREDVEAYVSFDGNAFEKCNRLNVAITGSETVQFKLVSKNDSSLSIMSDVAEIVDVKDTSDSRKINPYKYFESTTFTNFASDDNKISISSNSSGNGKIDFINKLILNNFALTFNIPENTAMSEFAIVLTDFYNRNNQVKIAFKTIGGEAKYVSINDTASQTLDEAWKSKNSIDLKFENNIIKIGTNVFEFENTLSDCYCLFSMEAKNIASGSTINILKIGNQTFNSETTRDRTNAMMLGSVPDSVFDINEKTELAPLYFADVLSPSSDENAFVSVYKTGGTRVYLVDENGVTMNNVHDFKSKHVVTFDSYGTYLVLYNYEDGAGNIDDNVGIRQSIRVYDDVPPTIEFVNYNGGIVSVSVNSNITPVQVKVSDNVTPSANISVYYVVYDAHSVIVATIYKGQTFKVTHSGDYIVYVYALDEVGNSSYLSYVMRA